MLSDKPIVRNLVEICAARGINHVIISPGSRNAPLIISFNEHEQFECLSIPDERVAGYFALGIAQQTRTPVIITCTSGTASLNFAPAIAEAFYQKIPLLIITADRPVEWIHQGEGQSINQREVFANYVLKSYQLPQEPTHKDELWSANRMLSEAIDTCYEKGGGPVHINIPFREPLYGQKDYSDEPLPLIAAHIKPNHFLNPAISESLQEQWDEAKKKLIVCGLLPKQQDNLSQLLEEVSRDTSVAVLSETTSNANNPFSFICTIDGILTLLTEEELAAFQPDLLLIIGGSFISKKLKHFLRNYPPSASWYVGEEGYLLDTFQSVDKWISIPVTDFIAGLTTTKFMEDEEVIDLEEGYRELWQNKYEIVKKHHQHFLDKVQWSDLKAYEIIVNALPDGSNLHMGNSTPVRYLQLFPPNSTIHYNSNRGVAGIDGCTSTAAGAAWVNDQLTVLITGDISFFYDSNAFWHQHLSPNLRVIIINNGGGNIFRYIPGPPTTNQLETYFETKQNLNAEHIAKTFNIVYYFAEEEKKLKEIVTKFFQSQANQRPAILEIKTDGEVSAAVFRDYYKSLIQIAS